MPTPAGFLGEKSRLRALLEHFSVFDDPREPWRVAHPLPEVLLLVVCGSVADYYSFPLMAGPMAQEFGLSKPEVCGAAAVGLAALFLLAFAVVARRYGAEARTGITTLTLWGGFASTVFVPLIQLLLDQLGWRPVLAAALWAATGSYDALLAAAFAGSVMVVLGFWAAALHSRHPGVAQ